MTITSLTRVLEAAGQSPIRRDLPDGTRMLLLPHGGRVIGLFSAASDENFLWTNPALNSEVTARELFTSADWRNSGGDRTWISPQIDVFFPRFPDVSVLRTPEALDSKDYTVEDGEDGPVFHNALALELSRSRRMVNLEIRKWWSAAVCPVPHDVEFAGYRQHVILRAPDGGVALWNLVQVPSGGEAMVPASGDAAPRVYVGEIAEGDLWRTPAQIRYRFGAGGIQKIGLPAYATPGMIAYLHDDELVVRIAHVAPLGDYVDVPWTDSGETLTGGDALQLCNVNCELGCFAELEHHAPLGCNDVSDLLAFRGPNESIRAIAESLLGAWSMRQ